MKKVFKLASRAPIGMDKCLYLFQIDFKLYLFQKLKYEERTTQNIGLAFDVLTPKLSYLIRFSLLIFETNAVERANSGQISLVVTCTADCTCHHLTIPVKI